jgi:hypothetical protein
MNTQEFIRLFSPRAFPGSALLANAMAKLPAITGADKTALSLTADVVLLDNAPVWQFVTPNADGWVITLPNSPAYGLIVIVNIDDTFNLIVEDSANNTLATLAAGEAGWFATDTEITP